MQIRKLDNAARLRLYSKLLYVCFKQKVLGTIGAQSSKRHQINTPQKTTNYVRPPLSQRKK